MISMKLMAIELTFETGEYEVMLSIGDTWKYVRKELALETDKNILCALCLDDLYPFDVQRPHSICHECGVGVCGDCIVKRFIDNSGVLVCCRCKLSSGTPMPAYIVKKKAQEMRAYYSQNLSDVLLL